MSITSHVYIYTYDSAVLIKTFASFKSIWRFLFDRRWPYFAFDWWDETEKRYLGRPGLLRRHVPFPLLGATTLGNDRVMITQCCHSIVVGLSFLLGWMMPCLQMTLYFYFLSHFYSWVVVCQSRGVLLLYGLMTFGLLKSSQPTIAGAWNTKGHGWVSGEHRAQKSWWLMITSGHVNWFYDVLHILYNPLLKSLASNLLYRLFQAVIGGYRCFLQGGTLVSWPLNSPKFNPSIRCLRWEQPWTRGASRHEPRAPAIVAQRGLGCASGAGALEILSVRREGYPLVI